MWYRPERATRVILALIGIGGALFAPWFVPLAAMVLLSIRFRAPEVLAIGLVVDFLWLPAHQWPLFTIAALILVWGLEPLRMRFLIT